MATLILSSLLWILTIDAIVASDCMKTERNALLTFKAGLFDPRNFLSSWEGENCCQWRGVICSNTTGRVVKLSLRNSYDRLSGICSCLSGEINPSLLLLTNLEYLDLSLNNFSGTSIPAFMGSFKNLRYLNLSNSFFGGTVPPQIGNLSKLHYLDLNSRIAYSSTFRVNGISWLTRLSFLKYLDMSFVDLSTATNWLDDVNMLPSLKELHLYLCSLPGISTTLSHVNFTTLNVLDLSGNFINSALPTWLWNLTSITYLDLSLNEFHGVISDEFRHLSTLTVLFLGFNSFKGMNPKAFRYLCNLGKLDLSSIGFGGEIIEWVEMLPRCMRNNLQSLYLEYNNLRGNISGWLERMIGLTDIDLSSNSLNGSIPVGIWKLPNLTSLFLSNNSLEGVISDVELSYSRKMQWLSLSFNSLIVRVRDDWVPPFQLKGIYLASCRLGPKFPAWLKGQSQLEELDLSRNKIAGTLPSRFWNISHYFRMLDLSDNRIKGRLPLSIGSTMLSYLNLSSNQFEGPLPSLPSNLEVIDLSNNFFTGALPNAVLPQLFLLLLSNNRIHGSIPSSLCESTSLGVLDLSNNSLLGEIPECIGKSQEILSVIDVSRNDLIGGIPNSICSLGAPSLLKLSSNGLSGEFPPLQNCTNLVFLDLGNNRFSGTIPLWVGESLTLLTVLKLSSNMFSGKIPPQIAQLGYLQILDLSGNKLSGQIPRSFGNFNWSALEEGRIDLIDDVGVNGYIVSLSLHVKGEELIFFHILDQVENIDLSNNNLSGEIPSEFTDLRALQYLNLSRNDLVGCIPEKIGKMQSLESLDLAMNKLSGDIPQSLSELTYLSHLNLSNNNFSGMIPTGNQLQTLNDPSIYIGNPYLRGPPSTKNCSSNEISYDDNEEPKDKFEWLWLYFSVILGFIAGFLVVYGALLLNRAWTNAYISMIDIICVKLYLVIKVPLVRLRRR